MCIRDSLSDVMDLAGTCIALVIGADEMVLRLILVGIAGTVIELCATVGAIDKTGENACFSRLCGSALVGS